jgi:DeoR family glycerol-3-phosphate regulon repressor
MIKTTRLVVAVPMQISFLGANQFGRESSLIIALMKDQFKSQEKVQGIQVISTGGAVESEFKALYGRWVVDSLQRINLNQIFISVGAISVDNGLMTQMHFINDLFPELFRRTQHINVLVDSSKFYKLCTFQISPLKPSFTIFTDKGLPEEVIKEIEAKGLKLFI